MATRIAFAATVASALVFTSLLASSLTIALGTGQASRLLAQADEANSLSVDSKVAAGVLGIELLTRVENVLSSSELPCFQLQNEVSNHVGVIRASSLSGPLRSEGVMTVSNSEPSSSSDEIFFPYNGSVQGTLNLVLSLHHTTQESVLGTSFYNSEQYSLHLPLRIYSIEAYCEDAKSIVSDALAVPGSLACNSSLVSRQVASLSATLSERARKSGLEANLSYGVEGVSNCAVYILLSVGEIAEGPGGPFTFTAVWEGSFEPRS